MRHDYESRLPFFCPLRTDFPDETPAATIKIENFLLLNCLTARSLHPTLSQLI